MIKRLHKLIASSISTIDYPKISKFHTWLNIPIIEEKSNLINRPNKSISFNFKFPRTTLVTENICLKMYRSRFISAITIEKRSSGKELIFNGPEFQQGVYSILFPQIFFANVEAEKPNILNIPILFDINLRVSLIYESSDFQPTAIFNIDILKIFVPKISTNLFYPIGKRNPIGKVFYEPDPGQAPLFGERERKSFNEIGGIRKSYSIEKGRYSTTLKKLSIWDLIYPLLLPPISFDFKEQFDFYSPLYGYQ